MVRWDRADALERWPSQNSCAVRDWEAAFEGGHPPLFSRINPFASRISQQRLTIFSSGFVFPDRLVILDRWMNRAEIYLSYARVWAAKSSLLREILEDFLCFKVQTVQILLSQVVCTIGSISDWTSCYPEATNLNQEEQKPNQFWGDTSFQKTLKIRNYHFHNSVLRNCIHCNNRSMLKITWNLCGACLQWTAPCWHFARQSRHFRMFFLCWRRQLYF